jgi:hypothetical protein
MNNQYERKLEEMVKINARWSESEWRLNFLRSFSPHPLTKPNAEQLREWDQQSRLLCSVWQTPPR